MKRLNLSASLGVAVREFPTSTGEVDYALFVDGKPVGVVEAKREEAGEHITDVEVQSGRYANSTFKWIKNEYAIRFAYEATDKIIRFTDYKDIKYRSRTVFSFHRPETLRDLLRQPDTIRNNMKSTSRRWTPTASVSTRLTPSTTWISPSRITAPRHWYRWQQVRARPLPR